VEIRDLLQRYNIRPSKGLGQNLLVADWAYERVVAASEITRDDFVLEVGPGLGTLTRRLADVAGHVTAVELDARMVAVLVDTLAGRTNVTVREGDILEIPPESLVQEPAAASCSRYKVVANLPYYITSRVLRHLLTATVRPSLLTLTVQKEVADRIIARPGGVEPACGECASLRRGHIGVRHPALGFLPGSQSVLGGSEHPHLSRASGAPGAGGTFL
jgi:16S rRNA (adenine1518-N6/adenine1519-N6)-dimethyltransferase